MKEWLIRVVAVCLLLILMELLLSEGKSKKYISGIIRLVLLIVLISPILAFSKINPDTLFEKIDLTSETTEKSFNHSDTDVLSDYIKRATEQQIESNLNALGGICEVDLTERKTGETLLLITVKENGINEKGENIYTNEKIKETVMHIIYINEDDIIIYGT